MNLNKATSLLQTNFDQFYFNSFTTDRCLPPFDEEAFRSTVQQSLGEIGKLKECSLTASVSVSGKIELEEFRTRDSPVRIGTKSLFQSSKQSNEDDDIPDSVFLSIDLEGETFSYCFL